MPLVNQNPEQHARDRIDRLLIDAGWLVQSKRDISVVASLGVVVRELQTTEGPADYVLVVDSKPAGVIEAKKDDEGFRLTVHESQTERYRTSPLKLLSNEAPLRFRYESTGGLTRFTDYQDPRPRSRPVFAFHSPDTLQKWLNEPATLRTRLHDIPTLDDLSDFMACYMPGQRHMRKPTRSEKNPEGRWRKYSYREITARDKTSLDIFWLKDKSLSDLDNLPEPEELAEDIVANLQAALTSFQGIASGLEE